MPVFFVEKMWEAFALKSFSDFFNKNMGVFGYKVVKHLTSWPLNKFVKLNSALNNWAQISMDLSEFKFCFEDSLIMNMNHTDGSHGWNML